MRGTARSQGPRTGGKKHGWTSIVFNTCTSVQQATLLLLLLLLMPAAGGARRRGFLKEVAKLCQQSWVLYCLLLDCGIDFDCLIAWLIYWLTDWLMHWLLQLFLLPSKFSWLTDWLIHWLLQSFLVPSKFSRLIESRTCPGSGKRSLLKVSCRSRLFPRKTGRMEGPRFTAQL